MSTKSGIVAFLLSKNCAPSFATGKKTLLRWHSCGSICLGQSHCRDVLCRHLLKALLLWDPEQKRAVRPDSLASPTEPSEDENECPVGRSAAWRMSLQRGRTMAQGTDKRISTSPLTRLSFAVPMDQLTRTSPAVFPS